MSMSRNLKELETQIEKTIYSLEQKRVSSNQFDSEVDEILDKYRQALLGINSSDFEVKMKLRRLLNLSRGYLESYSDYDQPFLQEMAKTEKIVKNVI